MRLVSSNLANCHATVQKLLIRQVGLGQSHILVTADLAIYSKAQQILWTKPDILEGKVTMRLGGMHLAMAFIASIVRRWWAPGHPYIIRNICKK